MKIFVFLFLMVCFAESFACGTTVQWFTAYGRATTLDQKTDFLKLHSCNAAMNYTPEEADPIIANVLVDAIKSGVNKNTIHKTLKKFNCVYSARELDIYNELKQLLTGEVLFSICKQEYLNALFIVNAPSGLALREGPSRQHKRIGAIANGRYVEVISKTDEWALIKSYNGTGYVFNPLLSPY